MQNKDGSSFIEYSSRPTKTIKNYSVDLFYLFIQCKLHLLFSFVKKRQYDKGFEIRIKKDLHVTKLSKTLC